jgi:hypothetical protein
MRVEHDEKVKRLKGTNLINLFKGILTAANKSISENKERILFVESELILSRQKMSEMGEGDARAQAEVAGRDETIQSLQNEVIELKLSRADEGEDLVFVLLT